MKKSAIIRIVLYSISAILLCGILIIGIFSNYSGLTHNLRLELSNIFDRTESDFDPSSSEANENNTLKYPSDIDKIEIDWLSGDIVINKSSSDEIEVNEESNRVLSDSDKMVCEVKENTLKIRFTKSQSSLLSLKNTLSKTLTVNLPEKVFAEVSVESVSAYVKICDLNTKDLDVETVSGNIDLKNITTDMIDVNSVSGNIEFYGDIAIEADFENVSGNISLAIPEETQWTADFDTVSGKFSTDFAVNNIGKSIFSTGSGSLKIELETVSGDVEIIRRN